MRLVDIIRMAAMPLMFVGVLLQATRRRLIRTLQKAQAYDDRSAVALPNARRLQTWWRSRLEADGVLEMTSDGRYWIDRSTLQRHQASRRRRGLKIVACVLLGAAIILVFQLRG